MSRCPVRETLKGRIEVSTYTPLEGGLVQNRFLFTLRQTVTKGLIKSSSSQNLTYLYAQGCFWLLEWGLSTKEIAESCGRDIRPWLKRL